MKDLYGTLTMKRRLRMICLWKEYYEFVELSNGTFSNIPKE